LLVDAFSFPCADFRSGLFDNAYFIDNSSELIASGRVSDPKSPSMNSFSSLSLASNASNVLSDASNSALIFSEST
jgi:hypothetical protein